MRPTDAALLALVLAGTAGMAWAVEALAPPLVGLADLGAHDGRAVAVEARVTRAWLAGSGAQVLRLADATGGAQAFWASAEPVEGAAVRAEGAVERMRGAWQLRVRALEVLAPAEAPLDAAAAARLAPALAGREVAVHGALRWPAEGESHLAGGGARLALRASPGVLAPLVGSPVVARGALAYDAAEARYVLEAWEVRPG